MAYTRKIYPFAVLATDVAIFTIRDGELKILLIQMKKPPYRGAWALPGGLIGARETPEKAAMRHLREKSGVSRSYLEQLYTFGALNRDPFGRVVSVAYMALVSSEDMHLTTTEAYSDIGWFPVRALPRLAYDHAAMIRYAVKRLRARIGYSTIVYGLLPREFRLSELQLVYEIILEKKLDKRNFRKHILKLGIIRSAYKKVGGVPSRPATLYRFMKQSPEIVSIIS